MDPYFQLISEETKYLEEVLLQESEAIRALSKNLDRSFTQALQYILKCEGKVITCGLGKSGHIAKKAAGTFSSTGTPSFFVHATEAVHGDLGMVNSQDLVIMYSYSGESEELLKMIPILKSSQVNTILITGRSESSCAKNSDLVLDIHVKKEACPHNLAPTTSTTVMMALSDALAIAVMKLKGFSETDFARYHPSGTLGKRLLLCVKDVMRTGEDLPLVSLTTSILDVMKSVSRAGAGGACVVDENNELIGFISDGDLRRHFLNVENPMQSIASDLANQCSLTIDPNTLAVEALEIFQNYPKKIGEIPVLNSSGKVIGSLVLKDLLRCGII